MESRAASTKHFIWIKGEDEPSVCTSGERVLDALERDGRMSVRVGCRRGGCGACRIRVLSGAYDTMKMSRAHISKQEQDQGYALCCRVLARSDLVLEPAFLGPLRSQETPDNQS